MRARAWLRTASSVVADRLSKKFFKHNPLFNALVDNVSRLAATIEPAAWFAPANVTSNIFSRDFTIQMLIALRILTRPTAKFPAAQIERGPTILIDDGTEVDEADSLHRGLETEEER